MTEKVPLEAVLRRASRMAENMFERDGEVTAFWLAETAGGRQQTIPTPMDVPPEMSAAEASHRSRAAACPIAVLSGSLP
jgi:hypothetical protein